MKIYTSYFANIKNLPDNIVPISISGKPPGGFKGLEYKKLAPKMAFFQVWKETGDDNYYIRHYFHDVLDNLKYEDVIKELTVMANGKDIALICYEKPEDFCHRHLVASWLGDYGIEVKEIEVRKEKKK